MAKLFLVSLALISCVTSEPSTDYNYPSAPSYSNNYNSLSDFGHYTNVPQTSEGYHVDPHLLEKIKHIILEDEIHNGPQEYEEKDKIVGIEFFGVQQSVQVAEFHDREGKSGWNSYHEDNPHDRYNSDSEPSYDTHQSSSYDKPIESSPSETSSSDNSYHNSYDAPPTDYQEPPPSDSSPWSNEGHVLDKRYIRTKRTPFYNPYGFAFNKFRY